MALTTAAALMQWIQTMGFTGVDVTNRFSKIPRKRPYITIMDEQPLAPGPLEDGGAGTAVETCIVDVWQDYKSRAQAGGVIEDATLAQRLVANMHGQRPVDALGKPILTDGTPRAYRVFVRANQKFTDPSVEDLVHNSITVEVRREI